MKSLKSVYGIRIFLMWLLVFTLSCNNELPPGFSFTTGGETVYHIRTGTVKNGKRAVITASVHGIVQGFTPEGKLLWTAETDGGFPFDLCVDDIDGDKLDEVLVASGNGSLFAFDQDGKLLWTFSGITPLYQVSVAQGTDGKAIIFTGGPEQILYALSPSGDVVNSIATEHCIRHIRTGNVMNDGKEYVALATTNSGLSGVLSLLLIDPSDMSVVWTRTNLGNWLANTGKRFFSLLVMNLDSDENEEIILSGGWGENGRVYAFDQDGKDLYSQSDNKIPNIPYRMNLLRQVTLPEDTCILGHFGNFLIIYETDGTLREVIHGSYSNADLWFDNELKTMFLGSPVSGGDEVYAIRLDQPGWQKQYESIQSVGRLAEIEDNLRLLNKQIADFEPPVYQPAQREVLVLSRKPRDKEFEHLSFISATSMSQKITDKNELWCKNTDIRQGYDLTVSEMIERAAKYEREGTDFIIWGGHGSAAYFPLPTFEKLINAAPRHLRGFEFAEMEGVDEHMQEVVKKIILPVAELCKKHGKFIVFRNKNIFWNGTCYVPFWREVLLNERYSDVIIPGLEETNCRTQELSLAGRIGLWQTGSFDKWACRMVTDNANFDRMFEYGGQQVIIHHLRNLVSTASLGAEVFFNSIHGGPDTDTLYTQLTTFYEMLEKGIIQIPEREQLLSLSEFAIGMKDPPSDTYIKHGTNGHKYWFPAEGKPEMVFDKLDTYFGGSSLDPHDYSFYAMNVKQRMTNFLPETPFGMTAIIPSETSTTGRFKKILVTDGQYFYDDQGAQHSASEYKPVVIKELEAAASGLPVLVRGEVHWSVVRLDEKHLRITLIDPGYLDPAQRTAVILLQNVEGKSCTDILSREVIPINDSRISVTIPAGIFKIVDVEL